MSEPVTTTNAENSVDTVALLEITPLNPADGKAVKQFAITVQNQCAYNVKVKDLTSDRVDYSTHLGYPLRTKVPEDKKNWDIEWKDYKPAKFTDATVYEAARGLKMSGYPWADPVDHCFTEKRTFQDYQGDTIQLDAKGRPLNPDGRTGMEGRGLLGKWGPNCAADPILLALIDGELHVAVVLRRDGSGWALPGGMVDDGETVTRTLTNEFGEEAGIKDLEFDEKKHTVFCGRVKNDPRNTDHAWMQTKAVWAFSATVHELRAGDDAVKAKWIPVSECKSLYADHGVMVDAAVKAYLKEKEGSNSAK